MMWPLLFLGAGVAALAAKSGSRDREEIELIRPVVPYAGPLVQGMIAVLIARQRTIEGEAPARAFKVAIVGTPTLAVPRVTGVMLEGVAPQGKGEFLEFAPEMIASLAASA